MKAVEKQIAGPYSRVVQPRNLLRLGFLPTSRMIVGSDTARLKTILVT